VLSDHEYRTLSALARTVVPRGGPFAAGADDVGLARLFDGYLADEPAQNVRELSLALTLVELGPVLFDGRLRTFSNLPPADQLAHWGSWSVSETLIRRKASIGFNKFFNLVFYGQPAIWPHLGYVDPAP
jgi:hypothetical protein